VPIITGGSSGAGSVALLSSTTLSGSGTFDVASIDQTYSDLLLVLIVRGTRAAVADSLILRFNNDNVAANYEGQKLNGNLAVAGAATVNAGTISGITIHDSMPAASAAANKFGTVECWVHGYASTAWLHNATSIAWGNYNGATAREVDYLAGQWSATTAINRVQVLGNTTANLATGSVLRIYGRL
jgi:hypothetical protein